MSASALLQYPEFIAAAVVTLLLIVKSNVRQNLHAPNFLRSVAMTLLQLTPLRYREWLSRNQNWAGWRSNTTAADFASVKLVAFLGVSALAFVIPGAVALLLAAVAFFIADLFLLVSVHRRQNEIKQALPQALDLIVLCVDAGLGLDATLQRVASDQAVLTHALNEELSTLGRDILLGMERTRAYTEMYKRTGVEELKMLGSALNQSTKLGLSISKILRSQAEFMRTRQSQRAEEHAAKLPVWMAFPLWFCIMPALMLIIIGPSLISFLSTAGHLPDWGW
jgi:tight adherence protein C